METTMDSPRPKGGPSQRYLQKRRQSLPAVLNPPDIALNVDQESTEEGSSSSPRSARKKPVAEEEMVMQLSKDISEVLKRYRTTGSTGTASLAKRPWFANVAGLNKEGGESPRPASTGRTGRRGSADMLTLTARVKAMKENSNKSILKPSRNNHFGVDTDESRGRANSWSPIPGSPRAGRQGGGDHSPADSESPCASPPPSYLLQRRRHSIDVVTSSTPRSILKTPRSSRIPPTIWDTTFDEAAGLGGSKPGMYGNINFNGEVSDNLPDGSDAFRQALGCLARHNQHKADDDYREIEQSDSDSEAVYSQIEESVPEKPKGRQRQRQPQRPVDYTCGDGEGSPTSHKKHVHFNDSETTYVS